MSLNKYLESEQTTVPTPSSPETASSPERTSESETASSPNRTSETEKTSSPESELEQDSDSDYDTISCASCQCISCCKQFRSMQALKYHNDHSVCNKHDYTNKNVCCYCQKKFSSKQKLNHHVEQKIKLRKAPATRIDLRCLQMIGQQ
jgi:hypothetical protein